MTDTYWHKQGSKPLFPDLLWSRPENRQHAGKLLIIGGNAHGFAAPASAYAAAVSSGVGAAQVLLPNALQKTIGSVLEQGVFAPSTPSGSFARLALAEWLDLANWADAVLLAGDLGRNSETAIVAEQFAQKYQGKLTITKDAVDMFYANPEHIITRPHTTLVLSLAQLQKLARAIHHPEPVTFDMGQAQLVTWLHEFTVAYPCHLVTYHHETLFVAVRGEVSTTTIGEQETWRVNTATVASVWWLQNPSNAFRALTTAIIPE